MVLTALADCRVSPSLVARVDPGLLAGDLAPEDAAARRAHKPPTSRRPMLVRACGSSPKRSRWRARAATRGWNSRARCCASCSPAKIRSLDALAARVGGARGAAPAPSAPASRRRSRSRYGRSRAEAGAERAQADRRARRCKKCARPGRAFGLRSRASGSRCALRSRARRSNRSRATRSSSGCPNLERRRVARPRSLVESAIADVSGAAARHAAGRRVGVRNRAAAPPASRSGEDPDALFDYANERIR